MLPVMILTMFATACATTPVNDYCLIATPAIYTVQDVDVISDALARWLDAHDSKYRAVCAGR